MTKTSNSPIFKLVEDNEKVVRDKLRTKNKEQLMLFKQDLDSTTLKEATKNRHIQNVTTYLQLYVSGRLAHEIDEDATDVSGYLGSFYIYDCMFSSVSGLKSNIVSIKKFYKSMLDHGIIDKEFYDEVMALFSEFKDSWIKSCRKYNRF